MYFLKVIRVLSKVVIFGIADKVLRSPSYSPHHASQESESWRLAAPYDMSSELFMLVTASRKPDVKMLTC